MHTAEHNAFRELVRSFVEREVNPQVESWEREGEMPLHDLFRQMASLGMMGLTYDPAYGGQGAEHRFTMILAEEFGRSDHGALPMALGVQVEMATPSLHEFGSEELKRRFLAPTLAGDMVAAIAVTEPDAGSDTAAIRTSATRDGEEWVINGSKMYITNGLQADWLCLMAKTSPEGGHHGMSQIIVPTDTPGLSTGKLDKLGMRASDTAMVALDDCRVPVANTIGEVGRGFQQQMRQFVVERMWAVYTTVGACQRAMERTIAYAKDRKTFGKRLVDHQHLQFVLADLLAELDLLRVYNEALVDAYQRGEDTRREAAIAKIKAGRLARDVAEWAIQIHGGLGYMEETWTSRFLRDNWLVGIGGGSTEIMQRIIVGLDVLGDSEA